MSKIEKKTSLYLFLLFLLIAIASGVTLLIIMITSGQSDWNINFANATPLEMLVAILGIVCAVSGILCAVFIIIYIVKVLKT